MCNIVHVLCDTLCVVDDILLIGGDIPPFSKQFSVLNKNQPLVTTCQKATLHVKHMQFMTTVDMNLDIHNPKPVDEPMHDLHALIC